MGEATYYVKARFKDQAAAEAALPGIKRFLSEGIEAQDWWQRNRGMEHDGQRAAFWDQFKAKFPMVVKYLESFHAGCGGGEHCLVGGDCNNDLAGFLDFGGCEDDLDAVEVHGDELVYSATVWHFARWDPFVAFLESKFGATETGWVSDEYLDPYDSIEMSASFARPK